MRTCSNEFNSAHIFLGLCTLFFFCCISCSNGNKGMVNVKAQHVLAEEKEIQIELNLIKSCLREFINLSNKNTILLDYNLTLKTLDVPPFKIKKGKWKIGRWIIDKVGTKEPIANYFIAYGSESLILDVFLSKQDGAYKVIDWKDEKVLGWD